MRKYCNNSEEECFCCGCDWHHKIHWYMAWQTNVRPWQSIGALAIMWKYCDSLHVWKPRRWMMTDYDNKDVETPWIIEGYRKRLYTVIHAPAKSSAWSRSLRILVAINTCKCVWVTNGRYVKVKQQPPAIGSWLEQEKLTARSHQYTTLWRSALTAIACHDAYILSGRC